MKINQRGYAEEFYYYPIENWDKSLSNLNRKKMITSDTVKNIATSIQNCNVRIVDMQQNKSNGCASLSTVGQEGIKNLKTGCVVVITANYQQLLQTLRIPPRKKMKLCLTAFSNDSGRYASSPSILEQIETAMDKMLVANCSSCSPNYPPSYEMTTNKSDFPLNKKVGRYVYLNANACVAQDGVYYKHYFVPDKKGKLLQWFSYAAQKPNTRSARVCCLLNSVNSFTSDGSGNIKHFEILNNPPKRNVLGPLGLKCLEQCELDEPGSVLVFVQL